MFRNLTKFNTNKYYNNSLQMRYGTFLPRPPQKPEDDLIMAFLLAGLGTSCGWLIVSDKKPIYTQNETNSRFFAYTLSGLSLSGAIGYFIKYARR